MTASARLEGDSAVSDGTVEEGGFSGYRATAPGAAEEGRRGTERGGREESAGGLFGATREGAPSGLGPEGGTPMAGRGGLAAVEEAGRNAPCGGGTTGAAEEEERAGTTGTNA